MWPEHHGIIQLQERAIRTTFPVRYDLRVRKWAPTLLGAQIAIAKNIRLD